MSPKNKTAFVNIRLTATEKSELEAIADTKNVRLSDLIRESVQNIIKRNRGSL